MIFSGSNISAIRRAKRLIAGNGMFGDGYRYGCTYRGGVGGGFFKIGRAHV